MRGIKDIINKNKNFKFVIITHNKEEYEALKEVLVELGYQHSIPLNELSVMMDERVKEEGYDCCWRISFSLILERCCLYSFAFLCLAFLMRSNFLSCSLPIAAAILFI